MSQQDDSRPVEIHLHSPTSSDDHVELLTTIAHYHRTAIRLGHGHTVNFERPWLPGSQCQFGLISLPYLDGPKLEWLEAGSKRIRFLWLIPITEAEKDYKKAEGLEALEKKFEEASFNYLDPERESVV